MSEPRETPYPIGPDAAEVIRVLQENAATVAGVGMAEVDRRRVLASVAHGLGLDVPPPPAAEPPAHVIKAMRAAVEAFDYDDPAAEPPRESLE